MFVNFLTFFFFGFLHALCSSMLQTKAFKITRNNQAESFQETASLFVQSCIEKFTSARQRAFRSLLVQVEKREVSTIETGLCHVSILYIRHVSTAGSCPDSAAADICPVSTADICPDSTEDNYAVSTEHMTAAGRRPAAAPSSVETG